MLGGTDCQEVIPIRGNGDFLAYGSPRISADMLSMGIQYQPYTAIPTLLGSYVGVLGHLWSQNDMIMSQLRLMATSNCFRHP